MESGRHFDGIILDVDGTIWNTTGIVSVAWNKAIEESGFCAQKVNAQMLQAEFGKTMDVIALDLWPNLPKEKRDILLSYCVTQEQLAVRETALDIMYPSVKETIQELSLQVDFFIVSNCQRGYIELMLEKTGLAPYIRDTECFGNTGKGKSENLMLLASRNSLTHPVYVGDTQGDSDACRQAHIPFIWASYGFGKTVSMYIEKIDRFCDLKRYCKNFL